MAFDFARVKKGYVFFLYLFEQNVFGVYLNIFSHYLKCHLILIMKSSSQSPEKRISINNSIKVNLEALICIILFIFSCRRSDWLLRVDMV